MNPNFIHTLSKNTNRSWLGLFSILIGLLAWHLITRYSGIPTFILPSPLSVWNRFMKAIGDGSLLHHTGITLVEILLGLLVGVIFATIVGYILAKSRSLERVLSPYLVASQAIPVIAIAPLLVIWLGDGILSKIVICALIVFFPVLVNTIVGVRAVPTALYDLMNSLHASRSQILWKVEVPASLPVFLGGLRIGATLIGDRRDGWRTGGCGRGTWLPLAVGRFSIRYTDGLCGCVHVDRTGFDVVWFCDIA